MTSSTEKIAAKSAHLGSPRVSTALSRALGAPRSAMTWEKIAANTMMSMTMEVVRTVSRKVWRIARQERLPYQKASSMLTTDPSAAASVGVTMPRYMEPSTTKIRMATGATSPKERSLSRNDPRSSAMRGAFSGQMSA